MSVKNFLVSPGPPIDTVSVVKSDDPDTPDRIEGRSVPAGARVELDPELRHNARQIQTGRLVEIETQPKRKTSKES